MSDLRIQISQINPTVGELSANYQKILTEIDYSKSQDVDILVFPEMSLPGNPPGHLIYDEIFLKECQDALQKIVSKSEGITTLVGSLQMENSSIYSASYLIDDGRMVDVMSKIIPTRTSPYNEKYYLSTGDGSKMFRKKEIPYMVVIGNDISLLVRYSKVPLSPEEPVFIIHPCAFPYELWQLSFYYEGVAKLTDDWRWHYLRANLVGGQDEIVFYGGSFAWDIKSGLVQRAPYFKEGRVLIDVVQDENGYTLKQISNSQPLQEKGIGEIYDALVLSTRDYFSKNDFKKAVVGISGGVDSALTATIAVDALGPENVIGVFMPTVFTSEESAEDADKVMRNLLLNIMNIPINELYENFKDELENKFAENLYDITDQNIQARLRGVILMAIANQYGAIVLATGNKSEGMVGYCTLYGDTVGGFAPLKDVYKTTVWELARYRNSLGDEIIPQRVIDKPPSAELKKDQKDEDDLPKYETLDRILKAYIEDNKDIDEIERMGVDREIIKKTISLIYKSQFKREQTTIGPNLNPGNIKDLSELPITNRFKTY